MDFGLRYLDRDAEPAAVAKSADAVDGQLGIVVGDTVRRLAGEGASIRPRAGQAAAFDIIGVARNPRRRTLHDLGHARRRPTGPVEFTVLPPARPIRHEPSGSDRRAGLAHRAFTGILLAACCAPGRRGAGGPDSHSDNHRTPAVRPFGGGRRRLERRPPYGRIPRWCSPSRRCQPARYARLRSGALMVQVAALPFASSQLCSDATIVRDTLGAPV